MMRCVALASVALGLLLSTACRLDTQVKLPPECVPGDEMCLSSDRIRQCQDDGQWSQPLDKDPPCFEGECVVQMGAAICAL